MRQDNPVQKRESKDKRAKTRLVEQRQKSGNERGQIRAREREGNERNEQTMLQDCACMHYLKAYQKTYQKDASVLTFSLFCKQLGMHSPCHKRVDKTRRLVSSLTLATLLNQRPRPRQPRHPDVVYVQQKKKPLQLAPRLSCRRAFPSPLFRWSLRCSILLR